MANKQRHDWSKYNSIEAIQEFIDQNNIKNFGDFNKRFGGLAKRAQRLGFKSNILFNKFNTKKFNTLNDFQEFIQENNIQTYTELNTKFQSLMSRLRRLGFKLSQLNFPKDGRKRTPKNAKWTEFTTLEDFQKFIDDNQIESCTEFDKSYSGLSRKLARLNFSLSDLKFKTKGISHLEKNVEKFLIENNINFISQKTFDDLGKLRFDFYLPEYNLILEPGGDQHFISIDCWGGEESLNETKQRDKQKFEYCKQNNITILYYFEFSRNFIYKLLETKGYDGEWYINFEKFTNRILEIIKNGKS